MPLGNFQPYLLSPPNLVEGLIVIQDRVLTFPNVVGRTARVVTVTPGVATQEVTVYRLTESLTGQTVTFTSDASPTAAEVVTGLITAFRANSILNGIFTVSGSTTLIITDRQPGLNNANVTFSDGGSTPTNTLSVANTTSPADPTDLLFGRALTVGTNGQIGRLSAALSSTNVFAGIAGFTQADIENVPGRLVAGYPSEAACNRVLKGQVAVWSDTAVNPTLGVYGVHATGRFRATADGGNASQIATGCSWISTTTAAGLAVMEINLPA